VRLALAYELIAVLPKDDVVVGRRKLERHEWTFDRADMHLEVSRYGRGRLDRHRPPPFRAAHLPSLSGRTVRQYSAKPAPLCPGLVVSRSMWKIRKRFPGSAISAVKPSTLFRGETAAIGSCATANQRTPRGRNLDDRSDCGVALDLVGLPRRVVAHVGA
jgi:hypothetical protein